MITCRCKTRLRFHKRLYKKTRSICKIIFRKVRWAVVKTITGGNLWWNQIRKEGSLQGIERLHGKSISFYFLVKPHCKAPLYMNDNGASETWLRFHSERNGLPQRPTPVWTSQYQALLSPMSKSVLASVEVGPWRKGWWYRCCPYEWPLLIWSSCDPHQEDISPQPSSETMEGCQMNSWSGHLANVAWTSKPAPTEQRNPKEWFGHSLVIFSYQPHCTPVKWKRD